MALNSRIFSQIQRFLKPFGTFGFHFGIVIFCLIYITLGAVFIYNLEQPKELDELKQVLDTLEQKQLQFLIDVIHLKYNLGEDEKEFKAILKKKILESEEFLLVLFNHPVAANYFDSLVFNNGTYKDQWTFSSSLLLSATTIIPVGFGFITPRTEAGKLFLIGYAVIGIPLALVTISDIGNFFCDFIFGLFKGNEKGGTFFVAFLILLYPVITSQLIYLCSHLELSDCYYYSIVCMFTIGFGDILPPIPIPFLILYLAFGVMLMTIGVEVIGANAIHHIHYMGRQMGKASHVATKFIQLAHAKLNINKGLELGIGQLNAFAKMGVMCNMDNESFKPLQHPASIAYEPQIPLKYVDMN
ncbi:unnamed protein product [Bursaphelenchus xylophilus]|uniref:(pine wood nematode) hypothetical protein n=1 Tax=Bursaphelenchus xylophilus TaxID=6326 RepID=A0A1I7S3G0_BURXY|nr:unnamed protein product [Bursaphelenchus xylophilus]CAG9116283.1 unnamed protein product [Bursaphelenchus xylophilus]